jgi:hypothetical protein
VFRFARSLCFGLGWPLIACSAPAPAETTLTLVSDRGLADADVRFQAPVERGDNELFVTLRPHAAAVEAELLAVDATMAAHAHQAHATSIDATSAGFHAAQLDLFMTGRWLITLELSFSGQTDSVSLPVDVP